MTTRGGRTRYELEVKTSRGPSQVISFWSTERGLKLDITDIDADGDLDIVLMPLFRRTAAAVWLNDGAGRFEQQIFDGGNPPILPAGQLRRLRARMDPGSPLVSCLRTTIQVRTSTSVLVLPGMFVASVGSFDQPARNVFGGSFPALRAPPRP